MKLFNLFENAEGLHIGDPVIITGNVEYNGTTGEIVGFGTDNKFVIVHLYNHGKHSFHSSDVSFNEYADSEEEENRWRARDLNQVKEYTDAQLRHQARAEVVRTAKHLNRYGEPVYEEAPEDRTHLIHAINQATGWDVSHLEFGSDEELKDLYNTYVLDEGWKDNIKKGIAGAALGAAALGAHAGGWSIGDPDIAAKQDRLNQLVQTQPSSQRAGNDLSFYGTPYLQSVVDGKAGRPLVSIDDAKAELQARANGKQQSTTPEPRGSGQLAPTDYQTKEPLKQGTDGKWYNSNGEERDSMHGGPVKNGHATMRSLKPLSSQDVEELKELSNDKLSQYKKAAGADATTADKAGNYRRGDKRFSGIIKATNKQFANDIKKHKDQSIQNVEESLADDMLAIAKKVNPNARLRGSREEEIARRDAMLAQRARDNANAPKIKSIGNEERAKLEAELEKLKAQFDPYYQYSDDHSVYTKHHSIAQNINSIENQLKQGLSEHGGGVNGMGSYIAWRKKANTEHGITKENKEYEQYRVDMIDRDGKLQGIYHKDNTHYNLENMLSDIKGYQRNNPRHTFQLYINDNPVDWKELVAKQGVAEGDDRTVANIKNYERELAKYKKFNANGAHDVKIKNLEKIIANLKSKQGVAEGLADTQQKIVDTINKLEDRLKHAKTPEQWDNIKDRIERLQAGLNRSKQGVAEGSLNEFAVEPSNGGDDDEYELLHRLVKMWWLGNEQQHAKAEKTLASMGISIDEDDPNIILRRGKQFLTFPMGDFQQDVAEGELDKFKKYVRPVVKTTPKIERTTNPAGRTNDHVEWIVTSDTGEKRRFTSKKLAQEYYDICTKQSMAEVTGDKSFDNMMKNISKGAKKQATVDKREQRAQSQQQARTAFGSMFSVGNPADKLKIKKQDMTEGQVQPLNVQQLATISDEALDNAYHYGRGQPGNTFGWQANLKSAAYAKQMIDQGVTDIEAISDAIHKGWNVTAQAFVKNPMMFDDSKTMAPEKLQAKIAQRQKLMTQNYAQLPEEEKEKDRVVARAMLQAIKGQQDVAENKINPAGLNHTQQIGDYVYRAKALTGSDEGEIEMTVYDGKKSIADTVFMPYGSGGRMISGQTYVHPAYRGKGVAAGMYAYLRMLGFKIEPSGIRTGAGKAMWDKWEKAGDAKHLSKGVAESELNTSWMNDTNKEFYNKNPGFKRDDRETKSVGNKLATKVNPAGVSKVTKKKITPFEEDISEVNDYFKRRQREKDIDAGKPVKSQPKNPQNDYIARRKKEQDVTEEASPMIKPPSNRFDTKEEAFAYARQYGGRVFKQRSVDPSSGMTWYSFVVRSETDEGSMSAAAHHPDGPVFKGYWKGTDAGTPKPGQGVGGCEEDIDESRSLGVVSSSIPKARNFVAKNSAMAGKAGQHKDKKRAEKQGDVKHKKDLIPVTENFVTWATNQGDRFKNFATDPEIYESARQEYKKKVLEFRNDHSPVAWHQTYYGGLDEENQSEDLQPGEYYIWTVYFDDDSSKRVKITFDDFDPYKYYAKQNKVVVNVDYNWSKHKN